MINGRTTASRTNIALTARWSRDAGPALAECCADVPDVDTTFRECWLSAVLSDRPHAVLIGVRGGALHQQKPARPLNLRQAQWNSQKWLPPVFNRWFINRPSSLRYYKMAAVFCGARGCVELTACEINHILLHVNHAEMERVGGGGGAKMKNLIVSRGLLEMRLMILTNSLFIFSV